MPHSDEQCMWCAEHVIPSDMAAGRRVLDEVLSALEAQHWNDHELYSVHLAMEEALVNAIMHGNRLDKQKRVQIHCCLFPMRIRIEIADEGPGFNPQVIPDPTDPDRLECPGGRGVMLMKAFMSRVEFNAAGNRVVLEKDREGHP